MRFVVFFNVLLEIKYVYLLYNSKMDKLWQKFLGLQQPQLPRDFHTEHFTNQELQSILDTWGGGNVIGEPTSIGRMAEWFYGMRDWEEFSTNEDVLGMWKDGLGRMLFFTWRMICEKRGMELPENW